MSPKAKRKEWTNKIRGKDFIYGTFAKVKQSFLCVEKREGLMVRLNSGRNEKTAILLRFKVVLACEGKNNFKGFSKMVVVTLVYNTVKSRLHLPGTVLSNVTPNFA